MFLLAFQLLTKLINQDWLVDMLLSSDTIV